MGTTNLFTQNNQTTEINGSATVGEFRYNITYNFDAQKKITDLNCSVSRTGNGESYGSISLNANKNVSMRNDADFGKALAGFDSVLAEIQSSLKTVV